MKPETCCAQKLEQVQSAWSLVYRRYSEEGLVFENPLGIHTVPQAVGSQACVIYQALRGEVISTMTAVADSDNHLPLDSVYGDELDDFRQQGRGLVEVGLMADRRRDMRRTMKALFSIMCWVAYYALNFDKGDIVVGVHPHHVRFYQRCFGFVIFGEEKEYPTVNRNPVVPLWLPLRDALEQPSLPPGLRYARTHPIPIENYSNRFLFDSSVLQGSLIQSFLEP